MEWKDCRKKLKVKILLNIEYREEFLSRIQQHYWQCQIKSNWLLTYYIGDDKLAKSLINFRVNMNLVKVYSNNIYKQLEDINRKIFVNVF